MEVITTPDPRLRKKSIKARFDDPEVAEIIEKMRKNTLEWEKKHPHELSAAMAAPQLGYNKRIIIVRDDFDDKENRHFTALLNPEVIKAEGPVVKDHEGCLSVPKYYGLVPRHEKVKVKAFLEDGKEVRLKADGFLARTLQHEIDHLNGVLFIDHIKDDPEAWFYIDDEDGELKPIEDFSEVENNKDLWPDD
ncbi:MAG: peptide deformylase [Candidatus Saccharibacteria bacterium]|nr:peptide deformylase [Candidatus Saccharibacteria bacterium]